MWTRRWTRERTLDVVTIIGSGERAKAPIAVAALRLSAPRLRTRTSGSRRMPSPLSPSGSTKAPPSVSTKRYSRIPRKVKLSAPSHSRKASASSRTPGVSGVAPQR